MHGMKTNKYDKSSVKFFSKETILEGKLLYEVSAMCKLETDMPKKPLALLVYVVYHAFLENTAVTLSAVPETEN